MPLGGSPPSESPDQPASLGLASLASKLCCIALFAIAGSDAAVQKARAFQASSPKTYRGRTSVRPFFLVVACAIRSVSSHRQKQEKRRGEAAGTTGTGALTCGGSSGCSPPPRSAHCTHDQGRSARRRLHGDCRTRRTADPVPPSCPNPCRLPGDGGDDALEHAELLVQEPPFARLAAFQHYASFGFWDREALLGKRHSRMWPRRTARAWSYTVS